MRKAKLAIAAAASAVAIIGSAGAAQAYSVDVGPYSSTDWLTISAGNYYSWNQNFAQICSDQSSSNSFEIRVLDPHGNTIIRSYPTIAPGACVGVYGDGRMWFPFNVNHEAFDVQVLSNGRVVADTGYVSPS